MLSSTPERQPENTLPNKPSNRPSETLQLLQEYARTGDVEVRNRIVLMHTGLVRHFARRLAGAGSTVEDLVQVGFVGLIAAIENFDPEHGALFESYAAPSIAGTMKRYLRDCTWMVHAPRRLRELGMTLRRVTSDMEGELGRSPTFPEISARLGIDEETIAEALELNRLYAPLSLDAPSADGIDTDFWKRLGGADPRLSAFAEKEALRTMIETLEPRLRKIIRRRFFDNLTQAIVAEEMRMSQMHVSRLERQALRQLREMLDGD